MNIDFLSLLFIASVELSIKNMRSKTSSWFETKVRYEKLMEDGQNKKVIEAYTVDALSFSEAESTITKEMSNYISGEFEVKAIARFCLSGNIL